MKEMQENLVRERRKAKRVPCSLLASFSSSEGEVGSSRCQDMSARGIKIFTSQALVPNSMITIEAATKIGFLELNGEVRWSKEVRRGFEAGVLFERPLPLLIEKIV